MLPMTFTDDDFKGIDPSQEDLMVITVNIDNFSIMKMLVDQGSSVDILYSKTFQRMKIPKEEMKSYNDQIFEFSRDRIGNRGSIELYTMFGEGRTSKTIKIRYSVIEANTSYNILLG